MYTLCFFQKGCDDSVYNVSLSVAMPEEVKGLAVPPTVFVCMENGEASVLQTQLTKIWPTLGNFSEFAYDLKINKSQLCVNVSTCFVDVPGDCEDSQLFRLAAFRELLGPQLRLNLSFSFTPHRFCLNLLGLFVSKFWFFMLVQNSLVSNLVKEVFIYTSRNVIPWFDERLSPNLVEKNPSGGSHRPHHECGTSLESCGTFRTYGTSEGMEKLFLAFCSYNFRWLRHFGCLEPLWALGSRDQKAQNRPF